MIKLSEPGFCPLWSRWAEGRGIFLSHFRAPRADEPTDARACEEHQANARQGELMIPGSRSRLWSGRPPIHMTPDGLTDGAFGSHPGEHLSLLIVCQRKSATYVKGSFCSAVRTQRPYSTCRQGEGCLEVPVSGAGVGVSQVGSLRLGLSEIVCPWLPVICWGLRCHLF